MYLDKSNKKSRRILDGGSRPLCKKMFSNTLPIILLTTKWLLFDDVNIIKQYLHIHDKRTLGNNFHGFTLSEKHELDD